MHGGRLLKFGCQQEAGMMQMLAAIMLGGRRFQRVSTVVYFILFFYLGHENNI